MEKRSNVEFVSKMYKYMKNDMSVETFMSKFNLSFDELRGILALCEVYGKNVTIEQKDDTYVFKKNVPKTIVTHKPDIYDEKLNHV